MKVHILSVYDKKAEVYGMLFPANTIGAAERMLSEQVNRQSDDNLVFKYPDDFALYNIGLWDDNLGVFDEVYSPPRHVCEALALKSL